MASDLVEMPYARLKLDNYCKFCVFGNVDEEKMLFYAQNNRILCSRVSENKKKNMPASTRAFLFFMVSRKLNGIIEQ